MHPLMYRRCLIRFSAAFGPCGLCREMGRPRQACLRCCALQDGLPTRHVCSLSEESVHGRCKAAACVAAELLLGSAFTHVACEAGPAHSMASLLKVRHIPVASHAWRWPRADETVTKKHIPADRLEAGPLPGSSRLRLPRSEPLASLSCAPGHTYRNELDSKASRCVTDIQPCSGQPHDARKMPDGRASADHASVKPDYRHPRC